MNCDGIEPDGENQKKWKEAEEKYVLGKFLKYKLRKWAEKERNRYKRKHFYFISHFFFFLKLDRDQWKIIELFFL